MQCRGDDRSVKSCFAEYPQIVNRGYTSAIQEFPVVCSPHVFQHLPVNTGLRSHGTEVEDDAPVKLPAVCLPEYLHGVTAGGYDRSVSDVKAQKTAAVPRELVSPVSVPTTFTIW